MKTDEPTFRSPVVRHAISLVVGLAVGVFFHYLLFRLTLPVQPFIYVAF
jgi:xanthosine utilization system XapX-like protein